MAGEKKYAIRRMLRGADGRMKVVYVDLFTYQPVTDVTGYKVLENGEEVPEDVDDVDNPDAQKPVAEAEQERVDNGESTPQQHNPPAKEFGSLYSTSATNKFPSAPSAPKAPTKTQLPGENTTGVGKVGNVERATLSPLERADADTHKSLERHVPDYVTKSAPKSPGGGFGVVDNFGEHRPNPPSDRITNAIGSSVENTFGGGHTIDRRSGQEVDVDGDGRIDAAERYGSHRHGTGQALDFDVLDPSGAKVTDPNKLKDFVSDFAYNNPNAGVGYGKGYMTDGRVHLDLSGSGGQWGAGGKKANIDPALDQTLDAARAGNRPTPFANAPTPTARPTTTGSPFASQDERMNTGSMKNAPKSPSNSFVSADKERIVSDPFVSQDERAGSTGNMGNRPSVAKDIINSAKNVSTSPTTSPRTTGSSVSFAGPGVTGITDAAGFSQELRDGSRNWRNNNPGNLEYGKFTKAMGAIGTDGRFAVFENYEQGRKAKEALLFDTPAYKNLSIDQAIQRYAPQFENNTAAYTKHILDDLGLPSGTMLSNLTPAQRQTMLNSMERVEGFKPGTVSKVPTAKGIAAERHWTGPNTGPGTPVENNARNRPSTSVGSTHATERGRDTSLGSRPASGPSHTSERERDTSLGGRDRTTGNSPSGGGRTSSSNHASERERDTSLGGGGGGSTSKGPGGTSKGVGESKSPTNDGNGGKKSPGGGF